MRRTADGTGAGPAHLLGQSSAYQAIIADARSDLQSAQEALRSVEGSWKPILPALARRGVAYAASLLAEPRVPSLRRNRLLLDLWDHGVEHDNRYCHRYLVPPFLRLAVTRRVMDVVSAGAALALEPRACRACRACRTTTQRPGAGAPDRGIEAHSGPTASVPPR